VRWSSPIKGFTTAASVNKECVEINPFACAMKDMPTSLGGRFHWNRVLLSVSLALCCGTGGGAAAGAKSKIVVGFSQIGAESAWRTANTDSIKSEAAKRGVDLRFADAQQKQENQIKALRSFIAQGVNVIAFSPVVETGWEPVLREIKKAGIPVILSDRSVDVTDNSLFATFIGSDFVEEGRRAAEWLIKATSGKAVIVELQGTAGSAPAIDRKKGFEAAISKYPDMKIVKSQSGDFTRAKGKEVMESFLKSPDAKQITALYAHNDDMALGAIQAMEEAGVKPGKDILIVSIDGVRGAFEAMAAGKLNCTVECNPLIGPQLFDAVEAVLANKTLPKRTVVQEGVYEQSQAAAALPNRHY
jgi:simple sugar transport system substrate-binding protein